MIIGFAVRKGVALSLTVLQFETGITEHNFEIPG
jgi:hypothetical protein